MAFERIIDNNENIHSDLKEIMKDSFNHIYQMMGENNFRRWLYGNNFPKKVRNVIIQHMSEEEEKEQSLGVEGFYRRKTNIVKVKKITRGVSIHELFHYLTDHGNNFGVFIDEGLTEYLAAVANDGKIEGTGYVENVDIVKYLHTMLGDRFIKAYLLGEKDSFNKNFSKVIQSDVNEVQEFYKKLDQYHLSRYNENISQDKKKQINDEKDIAIKEMFSKIVIGKISKKTKDLEFYKDGKFDVLSASQYIQTLINTTIPVLENNCVMMDSEKWIKETVTSCINSILGDSHLLIGVEKNEIEDKSAEFFKLFHLDIIPHHQENIKTGPNSTYIKQIPSKINLNVTEPEIADNDMTSKIFEKKLENELDNFKVLDFCDIVARISLRLNPSERELSALISEYSIKKFGNKVDIQFLDSFIKENLSKYKKIFTMEQERDFNTISSQYRKIDDNSYIEKRDNRYMYISIDENGKTHESELRNNYTYDSDDKYSIQIERIFESQIKFPKERTEEDIDSVFYRINNNGKTVLMSIKDEIESIELHGNLDKYKDYKICDIKDFKELELMKSLQESVKENIKNKKYLIIMDDDENPYEIEGVIYTNDIDSRSRNVDYKVLLQDLRKIQPIIQESKFSDLMMNELIEEVLDKTFGTHKNKKSDGKFTRKEHVQDAYDKIKNLIFEKDVDYEQLEETTKVLNEERKKIVEENKHITVVSFSTPEAKVNYKEKQKFNKYKKQSNLKFVLEYDYLNKSGYPGLNYCEQVGEISPELKKRHDETTFGLKGVGILGPSFNDRPRKILTDKLCKDLSRLTGELTDQKYKKDFLSKYTNRILRNIFEIESDYFEDEEYKKCYESIENAIVENVMEGIEIDSGVIEENSIILNERRIKRIRDDIKKSGHSIIFTDEITHTVYEQLVNLSKTLPQSELDLVIKSMVTVANKQYSKGEKDGDSKY